MCARKHRASGRYFTSECRPVSNYTSTAYSSPDLIGQNYDAVCPYFANCALSKSGQCGLDYKSPSLHSLSDFFQLRFSFIGQVGRVVAYEDTPTTPLVTVSFNDGRTAYVFEEDVIHLEYYKSMYEIWWVTRTRSKFIVEKRKGFNVTSPGCTFDVVNDRWVKIISRCS